MQTISAEEIRRAVQSALAEDVGPGDATTLATIPEEHTASAKMVAREKLTLAGITFAAETFRQLSSVLNLQQLHQDGETLARGETILRVQGNARAILTAERVALNFAQRLSGVATLTRTFVEAIAGTRAVILDTRKTTPGWRAFEKYAVSCGGGQNHRFGLHDLILIKDNHLAALRDASPNAIAAAVHLARAKYPGLEVEVEADTLSQFTQALDAGADIILLDNMQLDELRTAVNDCAGRARLEASGGVNLHTVRAIAETGVDYISVGAITHSAPAVDIGLDFES